MYRALAQQRSAAFDRLTAFALDEYVGLPHGHPESYRSVIDREVTLPLGLHASRVHVPPGSDDDVVAACSEYEEAIFAAGGIDLQILGIGATGHIGFNEPTFSLSSRTRMKTLTEATRSSNARFFSSPDEVPRHCITQGLGTIMEARSIVLVAQGEAKSNAIVKAIEGPVTSMVPASVLQSHNNATMILDTAAASRLTLTDYYRYACENRPSWQR